MEYSRKARRYTDPHSASPSSPVGVARAVGGGNLNTMLQSCSRTQLSTLTEASQGWRHLEILNTLMLSRAPLVVVGTVPHSFDHVLKPCDHTSMGTRPWHDTREYTNWHYVVFAAASFSALAFSAFAFSLAFSSFFLSSLFLSSSFFW